jgi:hypothetical protein
MPRQVLHPHAQCYFRFHQCRGLRTNSRPARRRPAPRGPLQRSTADAVGRRGQADFVTDRVIVHPSCGLIGRYRSIPSCNRPAFLRLVRLLTVLTIAVSAMCQTKSLVTYVSRSTESGRSAGHRVVRVHHRIVRSGFAVVSMEFSPTHEHRRAGRGRAGGDQRRPFTSASS